MKHVFLFDSKAFYNQQWKMDNIVDNIGQYFRTQEKPDFSVQYSRYRRNAIYLIQDEAEKAKPGDIVRIYAIGGEEMLYDCINGVAHFPNMQLAIVPHGEVNDFLDIFGKHQVDAFRDIPALIEADALPTDIINWDVNYALNSCYIGMNATISKNLKNLKTRLNKVIFLIFSKFISFINFFISALDKDIVRRKYKILIDDDKDYSGQYSLIHIANGPYFEGKKTGLTTAMPDDGLLDVALIKSSNLLGTLFSLGRYSRGKRPGNGIYIQAKKVSIQTENKMWIQLDNEYFLDTNINLSLVHNATQVVAVNNLTYPTASVSSH